ncbi:fasciclin domain-containing protein [Croceitalea rosinachiae]|uniref:Fasciclin domain-containing protein n=1 Tax=Croceitalea rosinachiae TaxID=3075596 RepID=A0ABU3AAV6_9FLAO|nr:fasciclin domain-containing protein [Croceitalea sp. F388]MDT0607314.1 fasciclin domain-containing protein [Croceitalea sp. F388]
MKSSLLLTYFISCFLLSNTVFSQSKSLTTLPSVIYLSKDKTIIQSTSDSDNHRILSKAVKAADLEDTLGQSGPFTIFAPSDSAFSKFSKDELDELFLSDNKKQLKALLKYHIVAGNLTASKILRALCRGEGKASFTTVQGAKINASMIGTDIILTDSFGNSAKITTADANQSNGVIHEIDSVILPSKI